MAKGIQLRVPEGIQLSPVLLDALKKFLPDYDLEYYSLKPNYQESYCKRADSLYQAFLFLLEAYPRPQHSRYVTTKTLKAYIDEFREFYAGKMATNVAVDLLQGDLKRFIAKVIDIIALGWGLTARNATELLNEAEQYTLMANGRRSLATLTPFDLGGAGDYVLQVDETLAPYDQDILQELAQLKALKYPKTPAWFRMLAEPGRHYMQAYFCNLDPQVTELVQDIDIFLYEWKDIKEKAVKISNDLEQIAQESLPLPRWFEKLPPHHRELMRVLATESVATIDEKLQKLRWTLLRGDYKDTLALLIKLPQWYWVLPGHQQYFLEHVLKNKERIEDAVSFLSSRHRTLPMPANFAVHHLSVVTSKGEIHRQYHAKYRSSHIATRDGVDLEWPEAVLRRHFLSNLAKVTEGAKAKQLISFQTLVSPIYALAKLIPDFKLDQMARVAIAEISRKRHLAIVKTNHSYNSAKFVLYTVAEAPEVKMFLEAVEPYGLYDREVGSLVAVYKSILNSGPGSATFCDSVGRELFLSSLEQLIILAVDGYSCGSCVSGKDRKAIESIHTDAMFLYKEIRGCWPLFNDTPVNRALFVSLVADLYLSRHHHIHAGQNAPGSEGIKTPDKYFPADIAAAINQRHSLEYDDRLATNNEVRKISIGSQASDGGLLPLDRLLCKLVAKQLGMEGCTRLYDALFLAFSGDMGHFVPGDSQKTWSARLFTSVDSIPTGIQQIRDVMTAQDSGENNIIRMTRIFEIILGRPTSGDSRTQATKSVYDMRYLLRPADSSSIEELAAQRVTEWRRLFEESKKEHGRVVAAV